MGKFSFSLIRKQLLSTFGLIMVHHRKLGLTPEPTCCLEQEADSSGKSVSLRLQAQVRR